MKKFKHHCTGTEINNSLEQRGTPCSSTVWVRAHTHARPGSRPDLRKPQGGPALRHRREESGLQFQARRGRCLYAPHGGIRTRDHCNAPPPPPSSATRRGPEPPRAAPPPLMTGHAPPPSPAPLPTVAHDRPLHPLAQEAQLLGVQQARVLLTQPDEGPQLAQLTRVHGGGAENDGSKHPTVPLPNRRAAPRKLPARSLATPTAPKATPTAPKPRPSAARRPELSRSGGGR